MAHTRSPFQLLSFYLGTKSETLVLAKTEHHPGDLHALIIWHIHNYLSLFYVTIFDYADAYVFIIHVLRSIH